MLKPNAHCTLYLQAGAGQYTRVPVAACFWQEEDDGGVSVLIPWEQAPELRTRYTGPDKERGYLVWGDCADEITDSATLRAFLAARHGAVRTIRAIIPLDYGNLRHYEVTAV